MKTFSLSVRTGAVLFGAVVLLSASIAFAAVQLSTSKQQVKTLKATLTYQDVIVAPDRAPGDSSQRLVTIAPFPPNTEIISAYMKVTSGFSHPVGSLEGRLGLYESGNSVFLIENISSGELANQGMLTFKDSTQTPITDRSDINLKLLVIAPGGDLAQLASGALEIYVSYLEH